MNCRPSSFRSLAAAAAADCSTSAAAMASRPHFRGGRPQGRRGYSDRTSGSPASGDAEFVSGDSHFRAAQDANRGFRPNYKAVPPPPMYSAGPQSRGPVSQPYRPGPPVMQQFPGPRGPRPYRPRQVRPDFGYSQQFRPQQMPHQFRPSQMQQQFRPRPSKPPDYREWECAKPGPSPSCERFTILSYNILADYLATDHWHKLYFHIPRYIMDWNWRKRNISFELGLWSADILCFQEVDRFQDIEEELRPRGYKGIWKMRTGDPADGCAIFWRVSRFKLLHEESIEYNKLGLRDNVAQICVFESLSEQISDGASSLSSSSARSNRVIVCNIHVLFNPKRGDIKLGQIRTLLEKAHSTSKLWDDAPVVICGDFNCTPESPMYNFLKEQKLDLSELPRDKVSGQISAEIRPPRPEFRGPAPEGSSQVSAVHYEKTEQGSTNSPPMGSCSNPVYSETADVREYVESNSQALSEGPDNSIKHQISPDNPSSDIPITSESVGSESSQLEEPLKKLSLDSASLECVEVAVPISAANDSNDNSNRHQILPDNPSSDIPITFESVGSESSQLEEPLEKLSLNSASPECVEVTISVSAANDSNDKPSNESASCESPSADFTLDEKFEELQSNEIAGGTEDKSGEDCDSFLSELHSTGPDPFPADLKFQSLDDEILNGNLYSKQDINSDMEKFSFSSSAWTPAEIETATGSADSKVMEHPLKLTSAYAEVESSSELRDSSGEPLVTSYHRRFSGAVDYIWHSDGLQTSKVLAPIPKHVMQQTRGFPTKKWGSDHIALVSEFAFTKDIPSENASR